MLFFVLISILNYEYAYIDFNDILLEMKSIQYIFISLIQDIIYNHIVFVCYLLELLNEAS